MFVKFSSGVVRADHTLSFCVAITCIAEASLAAAKRTGNLDLFVSKKVMSPTACSVRTRFELVLSFAKHVNEIARSARRERSYRYEREYKSNWFINMNT